MAGVGSRLESWLRSLLRLIAGFTFTEHGFQKLFGMFGGLNHHGATVHFFSLVWLAALMESIGGPLIFLGLFTRPVAFILSGEMAFAFFYAHFRRSFWPIVSGGELAMLYCFIFLYLSAAGGGLLSLDHLILKKKA